MTKEISLNHNKMVEKKVGREIKTRKTNHNTYKKEKKRIKCLSVILNVILSLEIFNFEAMSKSSCIPTHAVR